MARIIIGILLLLANLGTLLNPSSGIISNSDNAMAELGGYYLAKIIITALGIWLIYSGIKKRKKEETEHSK